MKHWPVQHIVAPLCSPCLCSCDLCLAVAIASAVLIAGHGWQKHKKHKNLGEPALSVGKGDLMRMTNER